MNFFKSAKDYSELVKLGHTLFALPFALSAICLAYINGYSIGFVKFLWILIAFTAARSAAMGFNRIADVKFDAENPRTKNRPLASGKIRIIDAKIFTAFSIAVFILSAAMINWLCFWLSFPALIVLLGYSYAKRFTICAHYILGLALACAPIGAWIAASDSFSPYILFLGGALLAHISGFDLIYALQDMDFDAKQNLRSIPAKFGRKTTLAFAMASFVAATIFLIFTGLAFKLNAIYAICVGIVAGLYAAGEIITIKYGEKKTELVFFYISVAISTVILFGVASNIF